LAVSTGAPIALQSMALIQETVDDLPTLYQVDIIDLNAVGPALRQEILKHGERL
jgi:hypothetical protein